LELEIDSDDELAKLKANEIINLKALKLAVREKSFHAKMLGRAH